MSQDFEDLVNEKSHELLDLESELNDKDEGIDDNENSGAAMEKHLCLLGEEDCYAVIDGKGRVI